MAIAIAAARHSFVSAWRVIALVIGTIQLVEYLGGVVRVPYGDIFLRVGVESAVGESRHGGIGDGLSQAPKL